MYDPDFVLGDNIDFKFLGCVCRATIVAKNVVFSRDALLVKFNTRKQKNIKIQKGIINYCPA